MSLAGMTLAQSEEPPAIDPQVAEILSEASTFLADQSKLSVNWFVSYDTILEGREKVTQTRSGFNLMSRDGGLYSYTERGLATRMFYFDGSRFTAYDVEKDAYAAADFGGDFEQLVEKIRTEYSLELPLWSILSTQFRGKFVETAEKSAYLGLTRVGGELAHHIAMSNYDEDWQIWIAADPDSPRILMLVGTDPYTQGWPQYRVYFSEWDFAPVIGEDAFVFEPGEDTEHMIWPKNPVE